MELEQNWKFVGVIFMIALFASITSFDMITHWNTKAREDTRILILGTGILGLLIVGMTSKNTPTFLVKMLLLGILILAGLLGARDKFNTEDKPIELYLIAYGSLTILLVSFSWWYLYSDTAQFVKEKSQNLKDFTSDTISDFKTRRQMRKRNRMAEESDRGLTEMQDSSYISGIFGDDE